MNLVADSYGGVIEQWSPYPDYNMPVKKPVWLSEPPVGYIIPLAADAAEYDYVEGIGHRNIGSWIDEAARQAAR